MILRSLSRRQAFDFWSLFRRWDIICHNCCLWFKLVDVSFIATKLANFIYVHELFSIIHNSRDWKHLGGAEFEMSYNLHCSICSHSKSQGGQLLMGLNWLGSDGNIVHVMKTVLIIYLYVISIKSDISLM